MKMRQARDTIDILIKESLHIDMLKSTVGAISCVPGLL